MPLRKTRKNLINHSEKSDIYTSIAEPLCTFPVWEAVPMLNAMESITVTQLASADQLPHHDWQRVAPAGDPFLNRDFLSICEAHGAAGAVFGWEPKHLVARSGDGRICGFLPAYLRFNSHGDFIHDWSWAGAYRQLGRSYYPKLLSGLPHTPVTGPRFLLAPDAPVPSTIAALTRAAREQAAEHDLSSWHVAFPAEEQLTALSDAGLVVSHNVQFHWLDQGFGDFDGFLASFSAEKRRKVRAERRKVCESGLQIETRHGHEVDPREWPTLHRLYAATFEKFGNLPVFSSACFADLARTLGDRMVLFIARDLGDPVAVAICYRSDEALFGRYWGSIGRFHSLHFELCFYRGIAYCLEHGLRRFEPGAGGEHKIARGFVPTTVASAHWIADPAMARLIARHLEVQRTGYAAYRDDAAEHLPFRRPL